MVVGVKIAKMVAVISVGTAKAVSRRCADDDAITATFGYGNFWIMWNQIYDSSPSTDA